MKKFLCAVLCFSWTIACAVGPDYHRPKIAVPKTYRGQTKEMTAESSPTTDAGPNESFGDLPWWEVFRDEELADLIREALEGNKDLKLAAARIEEARGRYRSVRGEQFPEIDFAPSVARTWTQKPQGFAPGPSGPIGQGSVTSVQVGVDLSYQADLWGQFRRGTEAARADLLASEAFRRTVLITLISDVARAYFDLRELDEELSISRQTLVSRQKSLNLVRQRLQGGVVSLLDVRQAEAERAAAARTIPEFIRLIGLKENEISLLLGRNPGGIQRRGRMNRQALPPHLPVDLPSRLLERRPDILDSEFELIAANARVGEAKALFFPQINLTSVLGMTSVGGPLGATSAAISVAGNLIQFLFDGGRRQGNYEAAKGRFQQALVRYEQVIQQSFREVSDSLISIEQLKGVRKEQAALVAASLDGLRLAEMRYDGGVSSYLEVLDAQRQSFSSQLELARTKRDQLVAVVQLYRSLGGGWSTGLPQSESLPNSETQPEKKSASKTSY